MLLPVVVGRADQVAFLLFTSAVALILCQFVLMGFPGTYPSLSDQEARVAVGALGFFGMMFLLASGLASVVSGSFAAGPTDLVVGVSVLVLTIGSYRSGVAVGVRHGDFSRIIRVRFLYGVLNLATVAAALLVSKSHLSLVIASALTHGCSAIFLFRGALSLDGIEVPNFKKALAFARRRVGQTVGALGQELGVQVVNLTLPFAGHYQEAWASVLRLTNGMMTIAGQLVGPHLDMSVASAIRSGEGAKPAVHAAVRRALYASAAMSAGVIGSAYALASMHDYTAGAVFLFASGGVVWASLFKIPVANQLTLLGRPHRSAAVSVGKVVASGAALSSLNGLTMLSVLSAIEVLFVLVFVAMLLGAVRSPCRVDAAATP
ncbi:hypothetical protein G6553_11860 [Nocardioides sp. IC4_145]|uniref:hypothetical protein n=1 Tax=Nocardioides sp. IC4_145 TaxID=2714037 RepID=UPI00140C3171|nr:hypothetical protein [Nocardioides sp. IC4_145]NHC23865.1 hypothetical protein [Nocardioides sp. IC4_145]